MPVDRHDVRLQIRISTSAAAEIEEFRVAEGLASPAEAVRLLLQIGLDAVTTQGRRFWDKRPETPTA